MDFSELAQLVRQNKDKFGATNSDGTPNEEAMASIQQFARQLANEMIKPKTSGHAKSKKKIKR